MTDKMSRPGKTGRAKPTDRVEATESSGSTGSAGLVPWRTVRDKLAATDPDWHSPERVQRRARFRDEMLTAISGRRLADLRRQIGLTQAELAINTGLTQARISQIENGHTVSLDTLRTYIAGLGGHIDIVAHLGDITLNIA